MTENEFMTRFQNELHKRTVADATDVAQEYRQHFAYKLADGYSEEEIAAKLGDPTLLAAQFAEAPKPKSGSKPFVIAGLCVTDLFAGLFFALLAAWGVVMAAAALAFAALAICLVCGLSPYQLIPSAPYWCGAALGLSLAPLAVLLAVGCVYYTAFLRQLGRSFGRFQRNALAAASGEAALPALSISPQFSSRTKRRLRSVALVALALFAACFVLAFIACSLSAESLQFWHAWGWFA